MLLLPRLQVSCRENASNFLECRRLSPSTYEYNYNCVRDLETQKERYLLFIASNKISISFIGFSAGIRSTNIRKQFWLRWLTLLYCNGRKRAPTLQTSRRPRCYDETNADRLRGWRTAFWSRKRCFRLLNNEEPLLYIPNIIYRH